MPRLVASGGVELKLTGLDELIRRAEAERLYRKALRKAMRLAGKAMKTEYLARARPISRRLAKGVRTKIKQGPAPAYLPVEVKVYPRYAGGPAIVSGRRAGAKQPPMAALKWGFPAARRVAARGLPGHPFVPQVMAAVAPQVTRLLAGVGQEMEQAWTR